MVLAKRVGRKPRELAELVRARLPALAIAREPEIIHELAQHLSDLYDEARASGASHERALARALSALPQRGDALAGEIESASRALPGLIADRWRLSESEPSTATRRLAMLSDFRQDVRYAARTFLASPLFAIVVFVTLAL